MVAHSYNLWCCLRHTRVKMIIPPCYNSQCCFVLYFFTNTVECCVQQGDDVCGMFQVKKLKMRRKKAIKIHAGGRRCTNAGYGCVLRTAFACKAIIYVFLQCGTRRCHSTDMKIALCFWFRVCADAISANRSGNDHTPIWRLARRKKSHLKMFAVGVCNACHGRIIRSSDNRSDPDACHMESKSDATMCLVVRIAY